MAGWADHVIQRKSKFLGKPKRQTTAPLKAGEFNSISQMSFPPNAMELGYMRSNRCSARDMEMHANYVE